ncbi:MAG: glycosyltransferase family 2 protein [Deltaproteobacteria bacterium]|nr:glycosyltransferase family 2 protein [Deltaproteobacteria bacterium]
MSLSFVLPAFNEVGNIGRSVARCVEVGESLGIRFEVIAVDDGSSDGTCRVLDACAAADLRVRAIHHPRNRGYGAALKTGLLAARMDRVFFTDADLQFDVAEVRHLLEYSAEFGVVAGYRAPRRDPVPRRLMGWGWSRLVGTLFDLEVRDVDCAFKVFDRRIFERIDIRSLGALVNTEILVRARAEGFALIEVPVTHYPRTAGEQSGANPRVVLKAFRELAGLYRELHGLSRGSAEQREGGL